MNYCREFASRMDPRERSGVLITEIITMKLQVITDYELVRDQSRGISRADAPLAEHHRPFGL